MLLFKTKIWTENNTIFNKFNLNINNFFQQNQVLLEFRVLNDNLSCDVKIYFFKLDTTLPNIFGSNISFQQKCSKERICLKTNFAKKTDDDLWRKYYQFHKKFIVKSNLPQILFTSKQNLLVKIGVLTKNNI